MDQCSHDAMQLQNLTNMHILWTKAASNAAMLPAAAEINMYISRAKAESNAAMLPYS